MKSVKRAHKHTHTHAQREREDDTFFKIGRLREERKEENFLSDKVFFSFFSPWSPLSLPLSCTKEGDKKEVFKRKNFENEIGNDSGTNHSPFSRFV